MRDALCVRHKTDRVSNPPSLTGEDDIVDEKPQAMRIASAGLDPAHLKRVEAAPTTSAIRAWLQDGARVVFREVRCDLEFFLGVQQQLPSLQAVRSIRQILSPQ